MEVKSEADEEGDMSCAEGDECCPGKGHMGDKREFCDTQWE